MGGSKTQTLGYRYFMGLHIALCHGPVDSVDQIFVGKRSLEITPVTSSQTVFVQKKDLFGGDAKEGGILGNVDFELGEGAQTVNGYLSGVLGVDTPSFRGTTCLVFRAGDDIQSTYPDYTSSSGGGYLAAMSPYPKAWAAQITDIPGGNFNPTKQIVNGSSNGGHIIYDCIINTDWGLGGPGDSIDTASFTTATDTLFDEGFGLSFIYAQQSTMEDFIQQVLTHINGVLYTSRSTGKHVLKLVRDDYTPGSLPVFDETNIASLVSFERPSFAELVNEVVLTYRLYDAFEDSTITVQDLASIQAQGAVISQTADFSGIDDADTAAKIAQREVKQSSTPLARVVLVANREAWDTNPADVIKFSWSLYGVSEMILRVLSVDYGTFEQGLVKIECVEDIFGVGAASYLAPVGSAWQEEVGVAQPAGSTKAGELPYYAIQTTFEQAVLDSLLEGASFLEDVAENPPVATFNYKLATRQGAADYVEVSDGAFAPTLQLVGVLDFTTKLAIPIKSFKGGLGLIRIGGYAYIGDEAVRVDAIDLDLLTIDIGRGYLDTIPQAHSADSVLYFADNNTAVDPTEYALSDVVNAKVLPQTSLSILAEGAAVEDTVTMVGRRDKPYGAANVTVNGLSFPAVIVSGTVILAWAHQDRTQQLVSGGDDWYDIDLSSPETGVVYNVRYYNHDTSALLKAELGLTGVNSQLQVVGAVDDNFNMRVEVEAVRDGETAFQPFSFVFDYTKPVEVRTTVAGDTRTLMNGDRRVLEN